jgi:hypothetical protein
MGGYGSGRRWASKETTGDYRQLDVRRLQRDGLLERRYSFGWRWSRNGESVGSISIHPEAHCVILKYRHGGAGEGGTDQEYPVFLERTPCHYGGERVWFRCPARGCGRRVAILYSGRVFACRHCYRLAYPCQHESPGDRADSRAWKIRERCGGWGSLLDPLFRSKGMHHRTFRRLARAYEQACSASAFAFSVRMGMTIDEVLRLAE